MKLCIDCGNISASSPCSACTRTRQARRDAIRGSRQQRGYGSAWMALSRACIARQPWCTWCGHTGDSTNPLTADHIVPKRQGGRDVMENLQTLCRKCNSSKGSRSGHPRGV